MLERLLTSMVSKTALPNILTIASNQSISSKDLYEVRIVSRDRTKTKRPQELGVINSSLFTLSKGQLNYVPILSLSLYLLVIRSSELQQKSPSDLNPR